MAEYISKEETLNIIPQYPLNYSHEQVEAFMKGFYQLYCSVKTEKAADVRPVVRGKWIIHNEIKNVYGGICIECPKCGEKYVVEYVADEKFCRNCGCDMRENENA